MTRLLATLLFLAPMVLTPMAAQTAFDADRVRALWTKEARGKTLTAEEREYLDAARAARQARASGQATNNDATIRGDGAGETVRVPPVRIPIAQSPIETLAATAEDGNAMEVLWRKPPGPGPFPAIIFIHGGLAHWEPQRMHNQLVGNPTHTRLLAAGYVVVASTFRSYRDDVQSRGPILDNQAVVEAVRALDAVDAESVAVFGGSGGGSIALELAGLESLAAVVVGEPATVLYTGMLTTGDYGPRIDMMANPSKYFTPDIRARTVAKLGGIGCPVLVLHGDVHPLKEMNNELFRPAMDEAKVEYEWKVFPGQEHGFYTGHKADLKTIERVVSEIRRFLEPKLRVQPSGFTPGI